MTDYYRVLDVDAARLLSAAVGEEIDMSDRLKQTESVRENLWAVCVNDVNEVGVGGIQFSRLFPEQVMSEERWGRVEARYAAQQQIFIFQNLRGAAGHVSAQAETDYVNIDGTDSYVDGIQEN